MVFCNIGLTYKKVKSNPVTILILVDGFLQFRFNEYGAFINESHNPYFSRWFSAIISI